MPIDEKLFRRLRRDFKYFKEYDKLGGRPEKRVVLTVTVPLYLKRRLIKEKNVSAAVTRALEKEFCIIRHKHRLHT